MWVAFQHRYSLEYTVRQYGIAQPALLYSFFSCSFRLSSDDSGSSHDAVEALIAKVSKVRNCQKVMVIIT